MVGSASHPDDDELRRFFDHTAELLCVIHPEGTFKSINAAWVNLFGWSENELRSEPLAFYLHPEDRETTMSELSRAVNSREVVSITNRFRHPDGSYRWLRWSVTNDDSPVLFAAAHDISDFRQATAEAQQSEELWRSVLQTAADPILVIDEAGTIQRANPATLTLFGYSLDQLIGQNVNVLMPEPYRREHDGYLHRYLETGEARIIGIGREVEAKRADGSVFPMALAVSQVETPDGYLFTGVIHDLTARVEAERRLREANEQLEARVRERTAELETSMTELSRSNRDLEQFAYIASHDLQAPLRNVRQGLELLDEHLAETAGAGFDDEAQELRRLVVEAVGRMEDLIRGLLSYSRVNRTTGPVDTTVDLSVLAADVRQQLKVDLETAGATVEINSLPIVAGDETQLRQLLQNLLQNAVKYRSVDRPPKIVISAANEDGRWVISIVDNGIGVDADQHERIFELFRRGHPGYEGVGLGLAICQRIVERHGGTIWVKSQPDSGSTFTFTLPISDPTFQEPAESLDVT